MLLCFLGKFFTFTLECIENASFSLIGLVIGISIGGLAVVIIGILVARKYRKTAVKNWL
jgi:hypothetical protein